MYTEGALSPSGGADQTAWSVMGGQTGDRGTDFGGTHTHTNNLTCPPLYT